MRRLVIKCANLTLDRGQVPSLRKTYSEMIKNTDFFKSQKIFDLKITKPSNAKAEMTY